MIDYIALCQAFRCPECHKTEISFYFCTSCTLISCNNPKCACAFGRDYWGFKTTHHQNPQFLIIIERGKFAIEEKVTTKERTIKPPVQAPKDLRNWF